MMEGLVISIISAAIIIVALIIFLCCIYRVADIDKALIVTGGKEPKIKVSGQFRSDDGAKNYATLMSIALTARENGKNPFFAFQKLAEYYEE